MYTAGSKYNQGHGGRIDRRDAEQNSTESNTQIFVHLVKL